MSEQLDLAGIGAGPANLSVAALAASLPGLRRRFFDRQTVHRWHSGLMLPGAVLQVSHLKDLVTLVDPTSPYTFLNFLACSDRLYRFASLARPVISRREYESYLRWVAGQLPEVSFGCAAREISFDGNLFQIRTDAGACAARSLSVAIGSVPHVPAAAAGLLGDTVLHSSRFGEASAAALRRRVVVVGGGQSGAEVFDHLLGLPADQAPASLTWINRRPGLQPLDDTPFTNEWFHPDYVRYFHGLTPGRRTELLGSQVLSSDGVSADLLERIYRRLYENDFVKPDPISYEILHGRELLRMTRSPQDGWQLELNQSDTGLREAVHADMVMLATGYRFQLPDFFAPLADRMPVPADGRLPLAVDYSLPWDGPADNKIFFLNAGRHSHGVADPNLSLGAWRAATVLSSIVATPWDRAISAGDSRPSRSISRWIRQPAGGPPPSEGRIPGESNDE